VSISAAARTALPAALKVCREHFSKRGELRGGGGGRQRGREEGGDPPFGSGMFIAQAADVQNASTAALCKTWRGACAAERPALRKSTCPGNLNLGCYCACCALWKAQHAAVGISRFQAFPSSSRGSAASAPGSCFARRLLPRWREGELTDKRADCDI